MSNRPLRVLLVDDEPVMRHVLRQIMTSDPGLELVGEAGDGAAAIQAAMELRPDVVVMDVSMPKIDGIEATRRLLKEASVPPKVLMLTGFDSDEMVLAALQAGASGFLTKTEATKTLTEAIRIAAEGDSLIAPGPTRRLISGLVTPRSEGSPWLRSLSPQERKVLELLAKGLSNEEISEKLSISRNTIRTHVSRVLMKLGLRDRVQAVVYAYEHDIVRADWPGR